MAIDNSNLNVALLIDADNASWHAIDPVLTVLAELGSVNVRRVYGNWTKPGLKGWRDMTVKYGIEPQQQFDLTKGKNATDMKMTIDAMDLLYRGRVQAFGIMSSDSDFMPLAMRIRQDGYDVYGFGSSRTPQAFQNACSRFIDIDKLAAAPASAPVEPVAATPPQASARKADVDPELVKLLIDAYDNVKRDERGFVSLSAMGQLAANRSSFDVRNYGFKRLSDLIQSVPNFSTERRDDGRVFVRRVH
ncbi:NYN domain-containing protein [Sphingomonas sp. CL5.1]|uniref:NYN domain-containing protein n=1 Tax=Sphingomonas sp. CL5.1 TaxID=2653203 RepID=UPI0015834974|nr:NYN domain-containing protein [Sphingomonas sp. CL5.1]QKS00837.1 NYN domain-containing protein [Sphingomonas sp. CL5.1]